MSSGPTTRIEILPGLVVSDPNIHHGAPVFAGTEVMIKTLLDYRAGHSPLYEFLLDFPEVRPSQAKKLIEWLAQQDEDGAPDALSRLLALRDEQQR
ncbi:MAG: DUF433 domain-containing protein, partial [Verrucomicrobia bacterium]|nr:DUF433 domain-containing protein [Verrucomicrobiota bacterium]